MGFGNRKKRVSSKKKPELIEIVTKIAKDNGKIKEFSNERPGERWYANFLKRNPEIALRQAESINKARAVITEEYLRSWFRDLKQYLKDIDAEDVMEDPRRWR